MFSDVFESLHIYQNICFVFTFLRNPCMNDYTRIYIYRDIGIDLDMAMYIYIYVLASIYRYAHIHFQIHTCM